MLMNFSPLGLMNKPTYQTLDEVEIAKQIESMEERENSHAFCLSYNLTMDIQTEEIVADFLATYGREVFALADELISGYMEIMA